MADQKSHREKFEELCSGYVLHALDEDEQHEFEQMLENASEEERTLYYQMTSAANQLAFTIEKNEPSERLKVRLMNQILSESEEVQKPEQQEKITPVKEDEDESFNWRVFAVAASFALLIVCLSLIFYSFNLSSQLSQKESVIEEQQTQITELKNEIQLKEEMLAILESREVDMVLMSGMDVNPDGYGKIIWDSEKQQALLQVSNLPPLPNDKDYQLWIIRDNKPVSAGLFAVHNQNDRFFKIEQMADVDEQSMNAFAVTMEPKGGMPQPTGDMYLMGKKGQ
jgi:anti-sigma-K factor RskA